MARLRIVWRGRRVFLFPLGRFRSSTGKCTQKNVCTRSWHNDFSYENSSELHITVRKTWYERGIWSSGAPSSAESSAVLVTMAKIACVHSHLYDDFQRLSASLDDCSAESSAVLVTMAKTACACPHLYVDFQLLSASLWNVMSAASVWQCFRSFCACCSALLSFRRKRGESTSSKEALFCLWLAQTAIGLTRVSPAFAGTTLSGQWIIGGWSSFTVFPPLARPLP